MSRKRWNGAWPLLMLIVAAVLVIVLSPSCSSDIDRSFGPEVLRGTGMLPGVVMSTSPPTGL